MHSKETDTNQPLDPLLRTASTKHHQILASYICIEIAKCCYEQQTTMNVAGTTFVLRQKEA